MTNTKPKIFRSKKKVKNDEKIKGERKPIDLDLSKGDLDNLDKTELLSILESINSDYDPLEDCRLSMYKPNHQVALEFHLSEADIRLATGGNRSSKTTTSIIDSMIYLTGIIPKALADFYDVESMELPQFHRIISTDFPNGIDKNILPMFRGAKSWFPADMILHWDAKSRTMQIKNVRGTVSTVEFMSYDQDVDKFQGTSRHRIIYDEEPPKHIRDECKMRIIDVDGREDFAMTPTHGVSWTSDEIYEKRGREVAFSEDRILDEGDLSEPCQLMGDPDFDNIINEGDSDIEVFAFYSIHNPNINQERVAKESKKMTNEERRMRIFGDYISQSGKVFPEFNAEKHRLKAPFEVPPDWPRYLALDLHARTPNAVMWIAVDKLERKWVIDELWTEEACTLTSLVTQMYEIEFNQVLDNHITFPEGFDKSMVEFENVNGLWQLKKPIPFRRPWTVWNLIDPAANIPNPLTGTSFVTDLARVYGTFRNGSKDLQRGIITTKQALSSDEVFFFPHLRRTFYEFKNYVWDSYQGKQQHSKELKQKPKDKDDHMMENLRRLLTEGCPYIERESFTEDISDWRQY